MGNGTKIGLVLVLVLVVVVIANLLDNEVDKGLDGKAQAPNIGDRLDPGRGTPAGARGTESGRSGSTPSYEAGRDRRLGGAEDRSGTTGSPSGRTGGAPTGNAPPSVLGDRSVAADPSGLRESPTGAGRPSPLDATGATPRPAAASASDASAHPAIAQDPATGRSSTSDPARTEIVGRDPAETRSGTPGAGTAAGTAPGTSPTVPPPPTTPRDDANRGGAPFPREHVVADGENLWKIAEKHYQKASLFTLILEGNPGLGSGDEIRVGQKIKIPAPPASVATKSSIASSATPGAAPAPPASGAAAKPIATPPKAGYKPYTIQDGDTLFDIAEDRLGSGQRWTEIQAANPGLDPGKLKVGVTIQIPGA